MKRVSKVLTALVLGTVLAGLAAGCSGGEKKADTIKVGANLEMTGGSASYGISSKNAIELAFKEINEKGGINGKQLELVVADNKSEAAEATNAMQKLVSQDNVVAVIGPNLSSSVIAASAINNSAKVLDIAPMATNPYVTVDQASGKTKDFNYRTCFIDPFQGKVMAEYAHQNGFKKVAIVQEVSNDYSVGLAKFFREEFVKLTGDENSIVDVANYQTGDKDFTAILTNIKALNPDAVFAPGNFTESALLVKQARQLGIDAQFMGGDTWETQEFIDVGGKDVEGVALSTAFDREKASTEEAKKFLDAYTKEYNGEPSALTAMAYDAYLIAVSGIEKAGTATDTVKIRDAIAATKDLECVTGMTTLDENGDPIKGVVIKTVKDGKFTFKDYVEAK